MMYDFWNKVINSLFIKELEDRVVQTSKQIIKLFFSSSGYELENSLVSYMLRKNYFVSKYILKNT